MRIAVLTRNQLIAVICQFAAGSEERIEEELNARLWQAEFWIDDDGLKVKSNNYSWSAGIGKVEERD